MNPDGAVPRLALLMHCARGLVLAYPDFGEAIVEFLHEDRGTVLRDTNKGYMIQAPADWGWPNAREG